MPASWKKETMYNFLSPKGNCKKHIEIMTFTAKTVRSAGSVKRLIYLHCYLLDGWWLKKVLSWSCKNLPQIESAKPLRGGYTRLVCHNSAFDSEFSKLRARSYRLLYEWQGFSFKCSLSEWTIMNVHFTASCSLSSGIAVEISSLKRFVF